MNGLVFGAFIIATGLLFTSSVENSISAKPNLPPFRSALKPLPHKNQLDSNNFATQASNRAVLLLWPYLEPRDILAGPVFYKTRPERRIIRKEGHSMNSTKIKTSVVLVSSLLAMLAMATPWKSASTRNWTRRRIRDKPGCACPAGRQAHA